MRIVANIEEMMIKPTGVVLSSYSLLFVVYMVAVKLAVASEPPNVIFFIGLYLNNCTRTAQNAHVQA